MSDIRNYGFAGALTLAGYPGEPARRPFEVAMRMWEKGFYVRYGGDTIQLGLPFVIETHEIDSLVSALGDTLQELAWTPRDPGPKSGEMPKSVMTVTGRRGRLGV